MQRWATVVIGAFLVAALGALVWKGPPAPASGELTGNAEHASHPTAPPETKPALDAGLWDDTLFADLLGADAQAARPSAAADPSAEPGIPLPQGSPKSIHFGVILVQYRGAQAAPASSRSKEEAASMARTLAEGAKSDFKAQVAKGDPGSTDDAGRMPRGVLEPTTEFALFTLPPGGVSDPIDTPRGFWIVRRIE
jgi:hypothetical protein